MHKKTIAEIKLFQQKTTPPPPPPPPPHKKKQKKKKKKKKNTQIVTPTKTSQNISNQKAR